MFEPMLGELSSNHIQTTAFGGINKTDKRKDFEFSSCNNLTAASYPVIENVRGGKLVWEDSDLDDIFPYEGGYLFFSHNKLKNIRFAENKTIALTEVGWKKAFTVFASIFDGQNTRIFLSYKNKDFNITAQAVSFDGGESEYTVERCGIDYYGNKQRSYFEIEGEISDEVCEVYLRNANADCLTVSTGVNRENTKTLAIDEILADNEIYSLIDKRLSLSFSVAGEYRDKVREIKVVSGQAFEGGTYLTFDREIYTVETGAKIYVYENQPIENDKTLRTVTDFDPLGITVDKEGKLFSEVFGRDVLPGKKIICAVGNKICIFPDKIMYDGDDLVFRDMEERAVVNGKFQSDAFEIESGSFFEYGFNEGDTVSFSEIGEQQGSDSLDDVIYVTIRKIETKKLTFNSNSVTAGEEGKYLISRTVPDFDVVCCKGNRLYGADKERIYVSKYGSPENFRFFQGGSMDSYYIDVSSSERFTACIPYASYVVFFKENEILKLYGDVPSEYQLVATKARGVGKNCDRALTEIGGGLIYPASDGVYSFTGGYPEKISDALGEMNIFSAASGTDNRIYIINTANEDGDKSTYTFDLETGLWLAEETEAVERFFMFESALMYLGSSGVWKMRKGERGKFFAEIGPISENTLQKKKYKRVYLRMELDEGACISVETAFDDGEYREIKNIFASFQRTVSVPIVPNRCDTFKIRLSGAGKVKILTLAREFTLGSFE